ncbi:MAG: hypothetical protein ACM3TR_08425 [Caulobacteraceae bacterium]
MTSWLTHLRIAEKVKQKINEIDYPYFMMGSIAPDSGTPDGSSVIYTPSKEVTHFRNQKDKSFPAAGAETFYDNYLIPEKIMTRSDSTRSFLWGYYFHLVADKLWYDEYFNPFRIDFENGNSGKDKDFISFIREEMQSLDFSYLKKNGDSLIKQLESANVNLNFFNGFDTDYIYKCRNRVVAFYSGEPENLKRDYRYLSAETLDEFVIKASESCINILIK